MLSYLKRIGIALSVLLNVLLGGKSNQTFSARNWHWLKNDKPNFVLIIDGIFVLVAHLVSFLLTLYYRKRIIYKLDNHCMESWIYWRLRKDVVYEINEGDNEWLKVRVENPKDLYHKEHTLM
jgi:hypothetical protein